MLFNKIVLKISCVLCSFFLILVCLLGSVFLNSYNLNFYVNEYNKYNLEDYTGLSEEDYSLGMDALLSYCQGKRDSINVEVTLNGNEQLLFNQREVDHMVDVANLAQFAWNIMIGSSICFLIWIFVLFKSSYPTISQLFKQCVSALLLVLTGVIIFLSMSIASNFDQFWITFHHLFFPQNDLWLLNPETDAMIRMLPGELFNDLVVRIIICFVITVVAFHSIIFILLKRKEKKS